jgi:hypothetical protein
VGVCGQALDAQWCPFQKAVVWARPIVYAHVLLEQRSKRIGQGLRPRLGVENAHPAVAALKPSIAETDDSACLNYSAGGKRL